MRVAPVAVLAAALAGGCACGGDERKDPSPTPPDPQLVLLLNSHEAPALESFARLGPATASHLRRIAEDPGGALVIRGRAVTALQAFPQDALSRPWLKVLVAAPEAPELLRRKAQDVLVRWGDGATTLTKTSGN